ncbi:MFS transporter [Paenibacillus gansuensis]|uniref:MFS transporter n=1 Tax=Paenibacillus gansuensis TaxID=306542 RepID=A0ABW5PEU5_9BACL
MNYTSWFNFRTDFIAAVTFSLFNVVFNQFYVPMAIQQGASNIQVGLLAAAPAIGLLFSPLWAGWIERTTPKPFVIVPNLIGRLLLVLPAFFGAPWVYVATALLFHLLMGIQAPAYAALITRIYPADLRGRLMSYVRIAMSALMIPLSFLVGIWTDFGGPSGPLLAAGLTGMLSILIFTRLKEDERPAAQPAVTKRSSLKEQWQVIRQHPGLAVFFTATTFAGFANILANPLYQIIQVERLGLSNVEIGWARMAYFSSLLVSYFVVGWVIDRFSPKHTLVYGLAAYTLIPLLYGVFFNYPAVIIGSAVQGVGDAIWDIGILAFVFRIAPGREAVVFGLHLMLFGIRGTIGPLISTGLSETVPLEALLFGACLCALIGTALFMAGSKDRTDTRQMNAGV